MVRPHYNLQAWKAAMALVKGVSTLSSVAGFRLFAPGDQVVANDTVSRSRDDEGV